MERDKLADTLQVLGMIADTAATIHGMNIRSKELTLDREARKAEVAQQILLKEYYDKKAEVKTTEAMFDKYDNLKPSDVSQGGADIINIIDEQNNIDMNAIISNLDMLSTYQSELQAGLGELKGQAQTLKQMQMDFAGANRVLEPHEYKAFQEHALKVLEEGGLGWKTTAGADVEYFKKDPTTRYVEALRITEKMKSDEDIGAKGNYAILQSIYTLKEGEISDNLIERLSYKDASGNVVEPSEDVVAVIQRMAMQPSYDDFITNLNAYPAELGGNLIRNELASNPNTAMIYSNLNQNYNAINALDIELAGINQPIAETNLDQFISNISGITNKQVLFGLYDQFTAGLDPSQHEQFFNAMEAELGGIDLGASYMEFKDFAGGGGTFAIPDIEIDGAFRSLEEGFALPENIFEERAKISRDRDYHLHDELEQFLQEEGIK